jgi:hypothetical protein
MALRQCGRDGLFCDGEPGRGATGVSVGGAGSRNNMRVKDLPSIPMDGNRHLQRLLFVPVSVGTMLLAACLGGSSPPAESAQAHELSYTISVNGDLTEGVPLRFEPLQFPRLDELRQRESLDSVTAGADSEFSEFLQLRDWASSQWPAGYPDPYPPWDAITVLDWIRQGTTGGFCAQYAQVLVQSLAALGHQARYIEIGSTDNPYAHFLPEVWSNQFNKWVVLDPDFNLHFERDGIPLSALEVHDALVRSELEDVDIMVGPRRPGHSNPASWPLRTAELYYYVRVHLNANHLSAPHEHPFHRYNDMIEWLDELTVPWEFSEVESVFAKVRLTNLQTDDRAYFEGRLNQVFVSVESNVAGVLQIRLENNSHGFLTYQMRTLARVRDNRPWQDHASSTVIWRPSRQSRILELRAVNQSGIPGPVSRVSVPFGRSGA